MCGSFLSSVIQQWIRDEERNAGDEDGRADQKHGEPEQLDNEGVMAGASTHVDPVAYAIHTYRRERGAYERRHSKGEKITVIILGATALFALMAFIASGIADIFFYAQLSEMRNEQRPWLTVTAIPKSGPYISGGTNVYIDVLFTIHNSGHSPAIGVSLRPTFGDYKVEVKNGQMIMTASDTIEKICRVPYTPNGGDIIAPGESVEQQIAMGVSLQQATTDAIDYAKAVHPAVLAIHPFIGGCVYYSFPWESGVHQTPFFYDVRVERPGLGTAGIPLQAIDQPLDDTHLARRGPPGDLTAR